MEKQKLEEETAKPIFEAWKKNAREVEAKDLQAFLEHLNDAYDHDYGTIVHACAAAALAGASAMNKQEQGGITGFQAGAVMWEFIRAWGFHDNRCGMRLVDYDNMLYPQYAPSFEKTIDAGTWEQMQKRAQELIDAAGDAEVGKVHPNVQAHWQSVVDGAVPFGYRVRVEADEEPSGPEGS
jgi:hypothetical protein